MSVRNALTWMRAESSHTSPGPPACALAQGLDYLALAALILTVFLISYWRPWTITILPHRPASVGYSPLLNFYASDIGAICTATLWVMARLCAIITRQARAPLRLDPAYLTLSMPALAALSALSATQAIAPILSIEVAIHLLVLTAFVIATINLRPPLWAIVAPLALLLAIEGILSLLQVWAQSTLHSHFLYGWNANVTALQPGASVVQLPGGARWLRAYGTFPHPNILGGFLCLAIPLVAGGYLRQHWRSLAAWVLLASLAMGLLALLLSFSRAAWLGIVAGALWAGLFFWLRRGLRLKAHLDEPANLSARRAWVRLTLLGLLGFGMVVGLVATLSPVLQSRLLLDNVPLEQYSVDERIVLLKASVTFLSEHPWLGVGAGNMTLVEDSYPPTRAIEQPTHNVPALIGVETGVFGLILCSIPPILALWIAWRRRFTISPAGLAASAALVALLVPAQLDDYLWATNIGRLLFALTLTLAILWCRQEDFRAKNAS